MIFNNEQILDVLSILDRYQSIFILNQLGVNYLTQSEKNILISVGIDLNEFKNKKGVIEHAFLFGMLSEAISDQRTKKMNYSQFQKFLKSGNFIPLTEQEEFALEQVKNRSFNDISGLGSRIKTGTSNVLIRSNQKQQAAVKKIIQEKSIEAVNLRMSASELARELGRATEDWERDFLRIAYYILHEAYNTGRAQSVLKNIGEEAEVYFDVFPGACKRCKELYLEDPNDPNSKPKVFKLKDIIANGNNIGRKVDEWLPTISPIHPYCRCIVNVKPKNMEWDSELRSFIIPVKVISKKFKDKLNIKIER